jgi:general secretion pathway protein A
MTSAFEHTRSPRSVRWMADHAAGNYRVLMNLGEELLTVAADRELARLDEKLFLEVYAPTPKPKAAVAARKR